MTSFLRNYGIQHIEYGISIRARVGCIYRMIFGYISSDVIAGQTRLSFTHTVYFIFLFSFINCLGGLRSIRRTEISSDLKKRKLLVTASPPQTREFQQVDACNKKNHYLNRGWAHLRYR